MHGIVAAMRRTLHVPMVLAVVFLASCSSIPSQLGDGGSPPPSPASTAPWVVEDHAVVEPSSPFEHFRTTPGDHEVRVLLYASPGNPRRLEYRQDSLDLVTDPVDMSEFWTNDFESHWGFTAEATPVNGILWLPDRPDPAPLVLVVHGNADPYLPSEFGYSYLASYLAGHGFAVASVDQTFLNGHSEENDARSILLLEHARALFAASAAGDGPLSGRLDANRLVLMGHSRGGEAVLLAPSLNRRGAYPGNGEVLLDYDLPLKAVVAIAPVEGQWRPAGKTVSPGGVDALVIHGAYDGDVDMPMGLRNIIVDAPAAQEWWAHVFIPRANHNQFNTVWAPSIDFRFNLSFDLLPAAVQQTVGRDLITRFLLGRVMGDGAMLEPFQRPYGVLDPPVAARGRGAPDIPSDPPEPLVITHRLGSDWIVVADFSEDDRLETASLPGVTIRAVGFDGWSEGRNHFESLGGFLGQPMWYPGYYLSVRHDEESNSAARVELRSSRGVSPEDFAALRVDAQLRSERPVRLRLVMEDRHWDVFLLPSPSDPVILTGTEPRAVYQSLVFPLQSGDAASPGEPVDLMSLVVVADGPYELRIHQVALLPAGPNQAAGGVR